MNDDLNTRALIERELSGAASATMLRNPLTLTVVRKTVLVPTIGNIAAPKFLLDIFPTVAWSAEVSYEVGTLNGAPNPAIGKVLDAGDPSAIYFVAKVAIPIGLIVVGEDTYSKRLPIICI